MPSPFAPHDSPINATPKPCDETFRRAKDFHKSGGAFFSRCERLAGCDLDADARYERESIFPYTPIRCWEGAKFPQDTVLLAVSAVCHLPVEDILEKTNKRDRVEARRLLYCVASGHGVSLNKIGTITGHDHSTVLTSLTRAADALANERDRLRRSRRAHRPFTFLLTRVWVRCLTERI